MNFNDVNARLHSYLQKTHSINLGRKHSFYNHITIVSIRIQELMLRNKVSQSFSFMNF